MTAALLLALAAHAAVDPCEPVEPAGPADPAAAEAYRTVGDGERAAGASDIAAVAYREALRRDPSNRHARAALQALCRRPAPASDPFQEGLRLMEAEEWRQAAAKLESARATGPDPPAALLAGICRQELGEDEAARQLLRAAERDPALRDSARFFLGLIALRTGSAGEAASLFESAAASPGLEAASADMARLARREGRVVLSFLGESGYDSNVDLTPDRAADPGKSGSGSAGLTALVLARPFGRTGPFATGSFIYRDQGRFRAYDLVSGGGSLGWEVGRGARYLHAEYGYDYRALGGAPYLSAHRLLGSAGLALGRVSLSATYLARFESFLPSASERYSGVRQQVEGGTAWRLGIGSSLGVAYRLGRADAREPAFSWSEHGPRADVRLRLGRGARLAVEGAATWRRYAALDPTLQVIRSDVYLDGAAACEVDVGLQWTVRLSLGARKAFSNVPEFAYTQIAPMLGLAYTVGFW